MGKFCYFVSDLHGSMGRYETLFKEIEMGKPQMVFLGGDLLPSAMYAYTSNSNKVEDFTQEIIIDGFQRLKQSMGTDYPRVFIILGNDDGKAEEQTFIDVEQQKLWYYLHGKYVEIDGYKFFGYSYIPPSPFMLKDWEKYDVSRYVDPGCTAVEEGVFSYEVDRKKIIYETIQKDLDKLTMDHELSNAVFLFHCPPYQTVLDRADLDGKTYEYVPLDVNIGSIAIKRFLESKQPLLSLHGHVHESTSITGSWQQNIGRTISMNAAHNKSELSIISFDLEDLQSASRRLI